MAWSASASINGRMSTQSLNGRGRPKARSLIDFRVEQEDSVYPMVPAGADLDAMIRRPEPSVLVETADDPI